MWNLSYLFLFGVIKLWIWFYAFIELSNYISCSVFMLLFYLWLFYAKHIPGIINKASKVKNKSNGISFIWYILWDFFSFFRFPPCWMPEPSFKFCKFWLARMRASLHHFILFSPLLEIIFKAFYLTNIGCHTKWEFSASYFRPSQLIFIRLG